MFESLIWAAVVTLAAAPFLFVGRFRAEDGGRGIGQGSDLSEAPCNHVVPGDVAEFVIPDFRAGIDSCEVHLNDPEAEFDALVAEDGVRFMFLDGGSFLEVVFPGLDRPPFGDTRIFGPGGAAGGRLLSDLVAAEPGCLGGAFQRVRSEIAAFHQFDAAGEIVEVWVPPGARGLPRIDVRPTGDGRDSEVVIDGRPAARLCGAPDASVRNVRVIPKWPGPRAGPPATRLSA